MMNKNKPKDLSHLDDPKQILDWANMRNIEIRRAETRADQAVRKEIERLENSLPPEEAKPQVMKLLRAHREQLNRYREEWDEIYSLMKVKLTEIHELERRRALKEYQHKHEQGSFPAGITPQIDDITRAIVSLGQGELQSMVETSVKPTKNDPAPPQDVILRCGGGSLTAEGKMLFLYVRMYVWHNDSREIMIDLKDYMNLRDIKNITDRRNSLISEIINIRDTKISWVNRETGKTAFDLSLFDSYSNMGEQGGDKDQFIISLTGKAFNAFRAAKAFHNYPKAVFRINQKLNPHSLSLLMYLADWRTRNRNSRSLESEGDDTTAVLNATDLIINIVIPDTPRKKERLIKPIERDLEALEALGSIKWEYEGGGKEWAGNYTTWIKKARFKITFISSAFGFSTPQIIDEKKGVDHAENL